jgi:predicted TIM-barrel fold metal-dependent hydrolase
MWETVFEDVLDLASLPWFDIDDGRLVLDPACGPVIDVHTHLALSYLVPPNVDLERETGEVDTYLPAKGRRVDLEVYANRNMSVEDRRVMAQDLVLGSFVRHGPRQTHTAANLLRQMSDLRIARAVIHAIDLPVISRNAEIYIDVCRAHPELAPFGSAHPATPFPGVRIDRLARLGARGIKIHPSDQAMSPDNRLMWRVYRACERNGLPVLYHCGPVGIEPDFVRDFSLVRKYEKPVACFPGVTFFLGHSGALQFREAIDLARRYPNVVLDLSCQGLEGIRAILETVDHDRIVHGSDWPFYHPGPAIAKVLIATDGDLALRRRVLHDTAVRLLGL